MLYRGTLNLDFTGVKSNAQTRLSLALRAAGWKHVETSAFVRDDCNLVDMWEGIGLVARYADRVGTLSALTFHVQGAAQDFSKSVPLSTTLNPSNALKKIKSRPFPG